MAGNLNSDSVIWVVGDTTGKNALGQSATIPLDITASGASGLASQAYVDAAVDVLHDRLVASGILES